MAKRIYHPKDRELFQFKEGGNFYLRKGDDEFSLETSDFAKAQDAKEYHKVLSSTYGAASFKTTFGKMFPEYLKYRLGQVKEGRRRADYIKSIEWYWTKYLESFWGSKRFIDFSQVTWDEFCAQTSRKFEVNDFTNHRSTMTGLLKWAQRKKLVIAWPSVENPEHKVRRRKIIKPEHLTLIFQNTPTVEEWRSHRKVVKVSKNRRSRDKLQRIIIPGGLRLFMALYLFQGTRRKENIELTWDRVDLVGRSLNFRDGDVKTNEGRHIPMNTVVQSLLLERAGLVQDLAISSAFVFPNARDLKRPMSLSGFKGSWAKTIEKSNLQDCEYTWHDFRATFEKFMHKDVRFTDTQREKMAGARINVQRDRYVTMDADDLRGLEDVVKVPGLLGSGRSSSEGQGNGGGNDVG